MPAFAWNSLPPVLFPPGRRRRTEVEAHRTVGVHEERVPLVVLARKGLGGLEFGARLRVVVYGGSDAFTRKGVSVRPWFAMVRPGNPSPRSLATLHLPLTTAFLLPRHGDAQAFLGGLVILPNQDFSLDITTEFYLYTERSVECHFLIACATIQAGNLHFFPA